jgi:hypothetical protein
MSIVFFSCFIATVIYMILAKYCMKRMSGYDNELTGDAVNDSMVLMKYVFFIKVAGESSSWNGLLWCARIFFMAGLSLYAMLVALIIFD